MAHSIPKRHPELVSGSHREPSLILLRGQMLKQVQHDSMHNVILNLVQDLSAEKVKKKARSEMLKRVQHDITRSQSQQTKN